jgi:hypothetical protein
VPGFGAGPWRDGSAMAAAHDLVVRSVSAGAALHAWPRSKVASEACARRRVTCRLGRALARPNAWRPFHVGSREELDPTYEELTQSSASQSQNSSRGATPMTSTQYAANMARTFMAAELAMASVNCGAPIVTRAQAVKSARRIFCSRRTGDPLDRGQPPGPTLLNWSAAAWPHGSKDTRGLGRSLCAPTRLSGSFLAQPATIFPPN